MLDDLDAFKERLCHNEERGDCIMPNVYKYRMAITSKGKGKSGGARVITHEVLVALNDTKATFIAIYDKSERSNISDREVRDLLWRSGLE